MFLNLKRLLFLIVLSVTLSLTLSIPGFAGGVFYVYKDKSGRTHIEDSIPGELAKYGYKIVNDKGITIKEIPSVASKLKKANDKQRLSETRRAEAEQKKKNRRLLRRFTSIEDIRETGNKKIMALQSQIDITENHIKAFEKNLQELEDHAKRLSHNTQSVPDNDLRDIERMKENIAKNKKYIEQRRSEQHKVREEFIVLIKKYRKLIANN